MIRWLPAARLLAAALCLVAGCTSPDATPPASAPPASGPSASASAASAGPAAPTPPPRVTVTRIRTADGSVVTVATFRSGRARIGVWHEGLPVPGEAVYSVRQNLWALVLNGRPTADAGGWWGGGGTVAHLEYVAHSALGQDAAGHLIYAASMSAVPQDLAVALARSGARIAMELDINPEWVQLAVARAPGGPLAAAIPGQVRPARQYLTGWIRDFIAVLAPGPA